MQRELIKKKNQHNTRTWTYAPSNNDSAVPCQKKMLCSLKKKKKKEKKRKSNDEVQICHQSHS